MLGILFSFWAVSVTAGQTQLASELFAEGNWPAACREAARVLDRDPADDEARLIGAIAEVRSAARFGPGGLRSSSRSEAVDALVRLAQSGRAASIRAAAACEAGLLIYRSGDGDRAYTLLRAAFLETSEGDELARASCAMDGILRERPDLEPTGSPLRLQIESCRALWTREVRSACAGEGRPSPQTRLLAWPGVWIVAFYRHAVGPALGNRCSLTPSCSRYFAEASRAHGLLAFPIVADRLVREPGVVAAGEHPILVDGHVRYADPLQAHDGWLRGR